MTSLMVIAVALLMAACVQYTEASEKSKLNANELEVLRYLENRDSPEGETGPKSFHRVTTGASKHQPFLVLEKESDGLLHFELRVRGDSPIDKPESLHPMTNAHWIETVFVLDQDDAVVFSHVFPRPAEGATAKIESVARFTLPADGPQRLLHPYEFCNLHGLWVGPSFKVGTRAVEDALEANKAI
jgi:desulfoferrodoxin (superoxide reductase-like protein)